MTSPYGRSGRRESQLVEWEDFFCAIHVHISQFTSIFSHCPSIKSPRHDRAGLILRIKKQNPSASWALRQRPNGDDIVFSHPFLRTSEQRSIDHGKCEQPSNPTSPAIGKFGKPFILTASGLEQLAPPPFANPVRERRFDSLFVIAGLLIE